MIRRRTLDNGIRIVMDPMESVRSCAIGVWLEMGSQREHVRRIRPRPLHRTHALQGHLALRRRSARRRTRPRRRSGQRLDESGNPRPDRLLHRRQGAPRPRAAHSHAPRFGVSRPKKSAANATSSSKNTKCTRTRPDDLIVDHFFRQSLARLAAGSSRARHAGHDPPLLLLAYPRLSGPRVSSLANRVTLAGSFDERACMSILRNRLAA
jgi:hypothetical protein